MATGGSPAMYGGGARPPLGLGWPRVDFLLGMM
jgi:hypothetical protein